MFRPGDGPAPTPSPVPCTSSNTASSVGDATIYHVLRKLLRGPLPVIRGRAKTFVEGPVDYTDLRTEFIGLIYEGLLDYRLKRTDEQIGPQVFLNLGREPVLPLARLEEMLREGQEGPEGPADHAAEGKGHGQCRRGEEEEAEEEADGRAGSRARKLTDEVEVEVEEAAADDGLHGGDYLDAVGGGQDAGPGRRWCWPGWSASKGKREPDTEYQARIEAEADRLIKRVVATGEFYLVRAGNTRKGTGTFYTRPQLAVPTVHRTLEPLCYDKADDGTLHPEEARGDPRPEGLRPGLRLGLVPGRRPALPDRRPVPARSATTASWTTRQQAKKMTLPYGRPRTSKEDEELVPFPPDDPQRGDTFADRVKALLRRHVVERCIYGVDINPLAVEFARVSLWVETLDPELPFSFLDHKIKVGNSLVGCWLDRVLDYPLKAWEREGGDGKDGPRTQRIETFLKGQKVGNRRTGDGRVKQEMRQIIESRFQGSRTLFADEHGHDRECVVDRTRTEIRDGCTNCRWHDPEERERIYRDHVENSPSLLATQSGRWTSGVRSGSGRPTRRALTHVPTPRNFHERTRRSGRRDRRAGRWRT